MSTTGVVLSGTGGVYQVRTAGGETVDTALRGRLKQERADADGRAPLKLAVGDDVELERDASDTRWAIGRIMPRRSKLSRREPGGRHGERVVAANVDQVVVVFAAANPEPHVRMLDRFLVIAEANEIAARVIVNKSDLVGGAAAARAPFAAYATIGYPVQAISVVRGEGIEEVRAVLAGRRSVVSGPSGVGKSTLLNALFPGLNLRVGDVSVSVNKGRHTTVGALLHPLADGGAIIDTPGLREVGLWGLSADELAACFPEFRPLLGECRFGNCAHTAEPGCAVLAAVGRTISRERYDSFLQLRAELADPSATGRS